MPRKQVLIVGASGLVGYAAMRHFGADPDCDVIALSRRAPDHTHGARFLPLDLTDAAACEQLAVSLPGVTHLVYAALYERPGLVAGWREREQIETNERMFRNVFDPLERHAKNLRHVTLLQGTKAYGVHVRPLAVPARENRSEMHEQPNFYWNQENHLRALQRGKDWTWSILRPVLIVGYSTGSAMNVIPALGVYGALRREAGLDLPFPGEIFNITNGDLFVWENIWPAIAIALGMRPGDHVPLSLDRDIRPREAEWETIRARYGLRSGNLCDFVGLSFEYADYTMGYGRNAPGPPAIVSTIKLMQAGFTEVMDTEAMFAKYFAEFQANRLLPPA
jgi:hypothetical protein